MESSYGDDDDSQSGQILSVFTSGEKDAWELFNTHGFTMTA